MSSHMGKAAVWPVHDSPAFGWRGRVPSPDGRHLPCGHWVQARGAAQGRPRPIGGGPVRPGSRGVGPRTEGAEPMVTPGRGVISTAQAAISCDPAACHLPVGSETTRPAFPWQPPSSRPSHCAVWVSVLLKMF